MAEVWKWKLVAAETVFKVLNLKELHNADVYISAQKECLDHYNVN